VKKLTSIASAAAAVIALAAPSAAQAKTTCHSEPAPSLGERQVPIVSSLTECNLPARVRWAGHGNNAGVDGYFSRRIAAGTIASEVAFAQPNHPWLTPNFHLAIGGSDWSMGTWKVHRWGMFDNGTSWLYAGYIVTRGNERVTFTLEQS
jgi:hypothetical protein